MSEFILYAILGICSLLLIRYLVQYYYSAESLTDYSRVTKTNIGTPYLVKPNLPSTTILYKDILSEQFPYFQNLSEDNKKIFLRRLNLFIKSHKFVPCEMPEVTTEMKVLISATAIQLTMGMPDFLALKIKGFKVYPKEYYSRFLESHLKGHFLSSGVIYLAYNHFTKGLDDQDDGLNLGLHEMAHALHHNYQQLHNYTIPFESIVQYWFKQASEDGHVEKPGNGNSFFRQYSATNVNEFFAVCVENFFERPEEFNKRLPQVYKHLCFMLNQNPLGIAYEQTTPQTQPKASDAKIVLPVQLRSQIVVLIACILLLVVFVMFDVNGVFILMLSMAIFFQPFIIGLTEQIFLFDNFIVTRNYFFKSKYHVISSESLLYIAHTWKKNTLQFSEVLEFVYYDNGLQQMTEIINPQKELLAQVKSYCEDRKLIFLQTIPHK